MADGEAPLKLLNGRSEVIDVLITDVIMPGVDGPALICNVRKTHPA